jgi:phosphoribosylanthranilate isomerase
MVWVKLCGMTRRADVEAAAAAGADAVGFVIAPGSTRRVTPEAAAALGRGIAPARFLVSLDLPPEEMLAAAGRAEVDGVQPYGRWSPEAAAAALEAGYRVLFPVAVTGPIDLQGAPAAAVPLLDCVSPGGQGGTGRSFDWSLAAGLLRPVVVAGGLTADNVGQAVAAASPWGVDVASGIEQTPGVKDHELMKRFVEAAKW